MTKPEDIQLPDGAHPAPGILTAGQPSPADFEALAKAGLRHVVDLRTDQEDHGFDEASYVKSLGMTRTVIPIAGPSDLSLENVRKLDAAIAAAGGGPVLVHCASSNRVGALLALRAHRLLKQSPEDALALGKAGGLTRMEPIVAHLLKG